MSEIPRTRIMTLDIAALADCILDAWREADLRRHVDDWPCGVPDKADIEAILHTAFFASIQREEGSFITFSLMFLQTHKDTQPRHVLNGANPALQLAQPVELSIDAVRKLAGALDERSASFIVEKRDGRFLITGIAPFGQLSSRLNPAAGLYPRPEALAISVRAPGSLLVSRAHGNLGRFASGQFEPAQVTPFHSQALGGDLIAEISTHEAYGRLQIPYWHWYRDALEHLLRAASARGRGGTIVWLPRRAVAPALAQTRLGYGIAGAGSIYATFLELVTQARINEIQARELLPERSTGSLNSAAQGFALALRVPELRARATTLLATLAQITCIDGATVIDDFLEPQIFGARLAASEWTGAVRLGPQPPAGIGEAVVRERFGTRHNSAIDFAGAMPGAIAFVLSQDGPVRAITRRGDTVLLWPDCLNTMLLD